MRLSLREVRLLDPASGREEETDIHIEDGVIAGIGPMAHEGTEELSCGGLCACPGLVDVHVHFREPGQTWKEEIVTAAHAAARGGFTGLVGMANTAPTISEVNTLQAVLEKGRKTGLRIFSAATLTQGMKGEALSPLKELAAAGAAAFSDDGRPVLDAQLLREGMREAAALHRIISLHEEDPAFIGTPGINAGRIAAEMGLEGAMAEAEWSMVERDIKLALETGCSVDFQHLSAAKSVELIRQALNGSGIETKETDRQLHTGSSGESAETVHRLQGGVFVNSAERDRLQKQFAEVSTGPSRSGFAEGELRNGISPADRRLHAEATPHHFTLTEEDVRRFGTLAKMNPPLRTREDREAIIRGLKENVIDIIATDHAPHAPWEKNRPFTEAPSGITGLESALSLGITELVRPGYLSLMELIAKMTVNPARAYGIPLGELKEGGYADITLFDPEEKYRLEEFLSKSSNSPFFGREFYGRVRLTICGGKILWRKGI